MTPRLPRSLAVMVVVALFFSAACNRVTPSAPETKTSKSHRLPPSAPPVCGRSRSVTKGAKYIDLTHTLTPSIPVWKGFGTSKFGPTVNPETGKPYTYARDGFEATHYDLSTDQYGTQLDPPAHWAPEYPAIDELPATYTVRPLVVISSSTSRQKPRLSYEGPRHREWEAKNGTFPQVGGHGPLRLVKGLARS